MGLPGIIYRLNGDNNSNCLLLALANSFALSDRFAPATIVEVSICFHVGVGLASSIVHRISNTSDGLFRFSLDLLGCAVNLSSCVSGPLAHLPLYAPSRVIRHSFYFVAIHDVTTSVGYRAPKKRRVLAHAPIIKTVCGQLLLERRSSSRNQLNDQNDQRKHQEQVDEATQGVAANYTE